MNSEALRRLVLESAPWLVGRVVLLPNAVDASPPPAGAGARLRAELDIASEAPLVGAVGRLTPMKGFAHLLGVWPLVLEKHPGARVVLFGDGELRGALEQQAARLGIAASVSFAGFRDDVGALYDACDVFVLPSVRDESMSHAALEAMAHARPVVASEIASGGLEAARERGACRIVPTGDERALAAALGAGLDPALVPYFNSGQRIRVLTSAGETVTGTVSATGGWQPVFILMRRRTSLGSRFTLDTSRCHPHASDTVVAVHDGRRYQPVGGGAL